MSDPVTAPAIPLSLALVGATVLLVSLIVAGAAWAEPVRYVLETPGVV